MDRVSIVLELHQTLLGDHVVNELEDEGIKVLSEEVSGKLGDLYQAAARLNFSEKYKGEL